MLSTALSARHCPLLVIVGLLLILGVASSAEAQTPSRTLLRGYIATTPAAEAVTVVSVSGRRDIFLPDVLVTLRNASNGQSTGPVVTDLSGRFTIALDGPARYQVCWKTHGFVDGCDKEIFRLAAAP